MRLLLTGISGMTGSHLADFILEKHPEYEVHGTARYRSDLYNIKGILNKITLHDCDLRDAHNVDRVIKKVMPDKVFHLAATSFVRSSFDQAAEVMHNNVTSQINLFEALIKHRPDVSISCAGSSEEYGLVNKTEIPIKETNPLRPLSPYGVSKIAQEMLCYQYHQSYGLRAIITRTFNHCSFRRTDVFVESNFCKQVAMIEAGLQEPIIKHGNLNSIRDYTDARDIAEAYWLANENCNPGEPYNICSGEWVTIGNLLDTILSLSTVTVRKEPDPSRMRPSDVTLLVGDYSKFKALTGWTPKIPFKQTLNDLLNTWRSRVVR